MANYRNKKSKPIRRAVRVLGVLIILGVLGAGLAWVALFGSVVPRDVTLYIPAGSDYATLLDSLYAGGKVSHPARFEAVAGAMKLDKSVKPGRYELRRGMGARPLASMLRGGMQAPLSLTFNNIRTLPQLAGRLGEELEADSAEFAALLLSPAVAREHGFSEREFIGMFIPDTYEVYWTVAPEALTERMAREWDAFWTPERTGKLARTGLTRKEVSTLASIVDEETVMADEMPAVAGVYINRLKQGMPLQADPTVKFAVGDFALRRILHKHLRIESPYNTYIHSGLPPGPIRMPSARAMDAVLNYTAHDHLYFCAKADFSGYHAFAKTLAAHNENARAYSRALDARGIR